MKQLLAFAVVIASSFPLFAQRHFEVFVDAEGVRRSNKIEFEPNVVQYVPRFDSGGGIGGGVNIFFTDRVSLEAKVAALETRLHLRRSGSDYVAVADLGYAQIYPMTALLQWHMFEGTALRPYIGAGAGYTILRNIKRQSLGLGGVNFENPWGFVVDGGLEIALGKKFSIIGDARYTPIETKSNVTFVGSPSAAKIDVKPLIVSAGIGYKF